MISNTRTIRTEEEFDIMLREIAEEILLENPEIVNGSNAGKSPAFLTLEGYVDLLGDSSLYEVVEAVLVEVIDVDSLFRLKEEVEEVRMRQNKLDHIERETIDKLWDKTQEA